MIKVDDLTFSVGNFSLNRISLHVEQGEHFVILGPTGAGKTLLLECLCGLSRIAAGRIEIGGADVTGLEPRERGIGYLPQDYALFPFKTVAQNIAFGLEAHGEPGKVVRARVAEVMDLLEIAHLAQRFPRNLSGGEKQRVALARALAIGPRALLLDEPVSALDEQTRDGLCRELKRLQRKTATTTIHVCHNFAEMLAVADRVAVLNEGRVIQVGEPRDILEHPRNRVVARFVQAANIFEARASTDGDLTRLICRQGHTFYSKATAEGNVAFIIRPESICLSRDRPAAIPTSMNVFTGSVKEIVDLGSLLKVTAACESGLEFLSCLSRREYDALNCAFGERLVLSFPPEKVHILENECSGPGAIPLKPRLNR